MSGFKAFLLKTNALALAVGVIIGVAMGDVVKSLVDDIIMPPIGMLLGNLDFSQLEIVLKASTDPTKEVAIRYGQFINVETRAQLNEQRFNVLTSLLLREAPKEPEPPPKPCQYCKETVPADATKCRACTSAI